MERYKWKAAISFQVVSVLNRFMTHYLYRLILFTVFQSYLPEQTLEKNKKWALVAHTFDSIHRLPILHPASG